MYSHRWHGGGHYNRTKRGGGNGWVRTNQQETNGPVLRGPKVNRTWKRAEQASGEDNSHGDTSKTNEVESTDSEKPKVEAKIRLNIEQNSEPARATNNALSQRNDNPTAPVMRKVGANKLVLKKKHASSEEESKGDAEKELDNSKSSSIGSVHKVGAFAAARKKPPHPRSETSRDHPLEKWKRVGSHKIVLKSEPVTAFVGVPDVDRERMKSRGRNKLVSESRLEEEGRLKESLKRKRMESKKGKAQGRAKRVKLSENNDTTAGDEKLTDFAYQQTFKKHRRNMGLVRVASVDAPICPWFLRGISCSDVKCKKRHDVPVEAATPICSFFQRQGQCTKRGACPFRHIKVSSFAMICPSFSLLGYCEDKSCEMKHVRQPKPSMK